MAPNIKALRDLHYLAESFTLGSQGDSKDFLYTSFTYYDANDHAYFGKIQKHKLEMSLEEVSAALTLIPDEDIYPLLSESGSLLCAAPDSINLVPANELKGVFIKRPPIKDYDWYEEEDCVFIIPATLLEEAAALQHISQHEQHPNLIKFHGCRVRRGRITGLMLDRYEHDLREFLRAGNTIDKERFLNGLESAIRHLHSLGLAHNDINPGNIMVNEASGEPVLVDFGSCHKIGAELTASRGTPGWTEDGDDYTTSKESHDISALDKIRLWLDKPIYTCNNS
ncbi:kinase-like protein [Hypoxylon sp. FL0890]|nr:kinase-like protein [Hypoxylon sp. FL0890]